jgi:hypothetical protein
VIPANDGVLNRGFAQYQAVWHMFFGDPRTGESAYVDLLADYEKRGTLHTDSAYRVSRQYGELLLRSNRNEDAMRRLTQTLEGQLRLRGEAHPDAAITRLLLGVGHLRAGQRKVAADNLTKAVDVLLKERGEEHAFTLSAQAYLAIASEQSDVAANRALADRFQKELGWQTGANILIEAITASPKRWIDGTSLPVVL